MGYTTVLNEPLFREWRAYGCSLSSCISAIATFAKIAIPALLLLASKGLWQKTMIVWEQPDVRFLHDYLLIVRSNEGYQFASSFSQLNEADAEKLAFANSEYTHNNEPDAISGAPTSQKLTLTFEFPTAGMANATFSSLSFVIFLKIQMSRAITFEAESALCGTIPLTLGNLVDVSAALRLHQLRPISDGDRQQIFAAPTRSSIAPSELTYPELCRAVRQQNIALELSRQTTNSMQSPTAPRLRIVLDILPQLVVRRTSTLELLKWAWIQFFGVYTAISWLMDKTIKLLCENGIIIAVARYNFEANKK